MSKYHYLKYFILCIIIHCGCRHGNEVLSGIQDNQQIAIKSKKGFYVCADLSRENQIVANRESIGNWEKFSIKLLKDNRITLKSSEGFYIAYQRDKDGLLSADSSALYENTLFELIAVDSGGFVLMNDRNKYVSIDANSALRANQNSIDTADTFFLSVLSSKKNFTSFSFVQLIPLILGLLFLFASLIVFLNNETSNSSIPLLLLAAFSMRVFIALLSPHLHWWDEQFHALVAKNMIDHPFMPMLYKNPVLPYDFTSWISGHIWLHKQPLFLWQMALSLKLFGINTLALRLPSILMSTAVTFFIYRIGKISVNNTAAYFAAFLFAVSNFSIEIAGGAIFTDHNDVAFLFYVSASVWAWVEYEHASSSGKKYFLILIGLFSGCAILVKWLTGLLVYSGWGLSIILSNERRNQWTHYFHLVISVVISVIIFLPWQIYILNAFPMESKYEFSFNIRHFFEVIEGHGGDFWFHFNSADIIYGVSKFFLLFCLIVFFKSVKNKIYNTAFLTYIISIYLFYNLAATKMLAFTYCISFLVFLSTGVFLEKYFRYLILNPEYVPLKIHKIIYTTIVLCIITVFSLNIDRTREIHTAFRQDEFSHLYKRLQTAPLIKNLSSVISNIEEYVIFNCRKEDNIPIMFFNNVVAAYGFIPKNETLMELKQKGHKIAIFDNDNLPEYIKNDPAVLIINEGYWNEK